MFWQIVAAIVGVSAIVLIDILMARHWKNIESFFNSKKGKEEE